MTLGDDAIDEYSRHILVPEIGPAGQARLLATRVVLAGDGPGMPLVRDLLARGGLRVGGPSGDAALCLGVAPAADAPSPCVACWGRDDVLHATTLTHHPCPACATLPGEPLPTSALGLQALATLAVTVLVLRIVGPTSRSTDVRLDLATGRLETEALAGAGCERCAAGGREVR